jgi:hypothetical protein
MAILRAIKASCSLNTLPCIYIYIGLINVHKFPLDNFNLQDPSIIIESSEMPTKSRYAAISIKVVHEQSGKVEYERERLPGTALKIH